MGSRGPQSAFTDVACPNKECCHYVKVNQGNIDSIGTKRTKSGRVWNFLCRNCGKSFCERRGTAFYDLRSPEDRVILAIKLLLRGMSLRGIVDVLGIKLDTVRLWLARCAEHAQAVNDQLVKEIGVNRVELDELWTFVKKNSSANGSVVNARRQDLGLDSLCARISTLHSSSCWSSNAGAS